MAFHHFNLFDQSDADVYTRIDLVCYDWKAHVETMIGSLFLYHDQMFPFVSPRPQITKGRIG